MNNFSLEKKERMVARTSPKKKKIDAPHSHNPIILIEIAMKVATSSLLVQFSFSLFSVWFPRKIVEQEEKNSWFFFQKEKFMVFLNLSFLCPMVACVVL